MTVFSVQPSNDTRTSPHPTAHQALRRLPDRERHRIIDRLDEHATVDQLVRETPYAGRWSA